MIGKINWKPDAKDLRLFGVVVIAGFGLLGLALEHKGHIHAAHMTWTVSATIGLWAIIFPQWARPFYLVWMGVAFVLGSIMSKVVMALIFYVILSPLAVVFRMRGRDALRLRGHRNSDESYWVDLPAITDKEYYKRLF